MEYQHEFQTVKEENEQKTEQEKAADRARQEQDWWRAVKYPDAPSSSER